MVDQGDLNQLIDQRFTLFLACFPLLVRNRKISANSRKTKAPGKAYIPNMVQKKRPISTMRNDIQANDHINLANKQS